MAGYANVGPEQVLKRLKEETGGRSALGSSMEATMPNLRMNSVLAFVSLILFIYQTHSNTCITYASYPRNETDRAALLAFKDKMIEDPLGIMSSWNESVSHCNWSGVYCSRRHVGRVTALDLMNQKLIGTIPPNIGNLTFLRVIDLSANRLRGNIPEEFGKLFRLTWLGLFNNELGGEIPRNLSSCIGSIPREIEKLNGLQILVLYNNSISGEIPDGIGKLQNLTYLYLWGNKISGAIPSSLGNVSQLLRLYLQYNQLEGDIPPSLGRCRQLQALWLSNNNFNGTIPKEVIGLSSLSLYFGVAGNSLMGPLPLEVGNMSQIVQVDLSDNRLTGEIPSTLSQCLMLVSLGMAGNFFEGSIPHSLRTLIGLLYLNLSRNKLSGQIPIYFENFTVLEALDLSFNGLEGEVPQEGIFKDTKRISIMGNEELCGGIKELGLPACKVSNMKKRRKIPKLKISIAITILFLIMLTCFIVILYWRRKSTTRPSMALPTDECFLKVSYAKLRQATNEFSPSNLIGQGSHGFVYQGILDGNRLVAVKVLNLSQKGAFKSFLVECEALRSIRHRNLVNIITVCSSIDFTGAEFKALVYDLMQNGSLERWLHPSENSLDMPKLNLNQRLDIAIDVASAIEYLHHHCQTSIIHGDLKPSNVLLDHDMVARVCDFGLARFLRGSTSQDASQCQASSSLLKGTIGYVAPEYGLGSASSLQGDVYSFGILLLEMFTGIRPTDVMFKDGWTLHEFVKTTQRGSLVKILDPKLVSIEYPAGIDDSQISDVDMVRFEENIADIMRIGVSCSTKLPIERMDMMNALSELCVVKKKFFKHGM
ncbi:probable LRR receptor-like serine/threonine-protein kinase At3g47570 [Eucalyptus grandis]|uniref:probable LRR receptor-like serine/threonine-protein kinase At3g47570 n=1 Tax=Eucalyptus grandis TaxID=71139 RepID=UPI00192EF2F3|nr:probable LRR receptor-like serine/threonine-protein kinase At3g47570 [Eucalyptus grandis]